MSNGPDDLIKMVYETWFQETTRRTKDLLKVGLNNAPRILPITAELEWIIIVLYS